MLTLVRICQLQALRPRTLALPGSQNLPLLIQGIRWKSDKRLVVFPLNANTNLLSQKLCLLKTYVFNLERVLLPNR